MRRERRSNPAARLLAAKQGKPAAPEQVSLRRKTALMLLVSAALAAQTPSTYRVTHTYLRWALRQLGLRTRIRLITGYFARQNRVMVVDTDSGSCSAR